MSNLPGDPAGYAGPIREIDLRLVNLARARVSAIDLQLDYQAPLGSLGELNIYAIGTWQMDFKRSIGSTSAAIDFVGYSGGPLAWRGNAGATWRIGNWTLGWNAQYYHSYYTYAADDAPSQIDRRLQLQGARRIPAQIYNDLFVTYRVPPTAPGIFGGTDLSVGIQNVFDRQPPIVATEGGSPGYSTYGDPRLRRFTLTIRRRL